MTHSSQSDRKGPSKAGSFLEEEGNLNGNDRNSLQTRFSGAIGMVKDDIVRSEFMQIKLPEFFGVKAIQEQHGILKGRHPASMKKESELWHYTKQSNERHRRIKKGHSFWDVINENSQQHMDSIELTSPKDKKLKRIVPGLLPQSYSPASRQQARSMASSANSSNQRRPADLNMTASTDMSTASQPQQQEKNLNIASSPTNNINNLKGNSLQAQLKNAMSSKHGDINLKVDFQNRTLINYNMTFMIMNYNDEVLCVNKDNQFFVKSTKDMKLSDKAKFKIVDINNPSNPKTVKFGDNLWLQVLSLNEENTQENTFQYGSVVATKLFEPIEVKEVKYDPEFLTSSIQHSTKMLQENHQRIIRKLDPRRGKMALLSDLLKESERMAKEAARQAQLEDPTLHFAFLSEKEIINKDDDEYKEDGDQDNDDDEKNSSIRENPEGKPRPYTSETNLGAETSNLMKNKQSRQEQLNAQMKVCGYLDSVRMLDPNKTVSDANIMSDDKCARYVNKTLVNLGQFTIHSAVRLEDPSQVSEHFHKHLPKKKQTADGLQTVEEYNPDDDNNNDMNNNLNNNDKNSLKDMIYSHLISATPIVIQQDQYCLSTAAPQEYVHWPPDSTYIVNHSELIPKDLAKEYDHDYHQFLKTNANHLELLPELPPLYGKTLKANEIKLKRQPSLELNENNNNNNSNTNTNTSASRVSNLSSLNYNKQQQAQQQQRPQEPTDRSKHDFVCLRKIMHRPAPYDFTVDRRSVWKLCLFEQFSDNYMQTKKEKEVKKVMETANMVLKLSKLNREGAKTHIKENHIEKLPPLTSGEKFVDNLRELRFKKNLHRSLVSLESRRNNELQLQDYFALRINDVLENEKTGFKHNLTRMRSGKELFSSRDAAEMMSKSHSLEEGIENDFKPFEDYHYQQLTSSANSLSSLTGAGTGTPSTTLMFPPPSRSIYSKQSTRRGGGGASRQRKTAKLSDASSAEKYITSEFPQPDPSEIFANSSIASKYYSVNSNNSFKTKKVVHHQFPPPKTASNNSQQRSTTTTSKKLNRNSNSSAGNSGSNYERNVMTSPVLKGGGRNNNTTTNTDLTTSQSSNHNNNHVNFSDQQPPFFSPIGSPIGAGGIHDGGGPGVDNGGDFDDNASGVSLLSMGSIGGDSISSQIYNNLNNANATQSNTKSNNKAYRHVVKNHFSEDIKKAFNTNIPFPYEKKLLLTQNEAIHEFPELSAGEQLLSYHRTMKHLNQTGKVNELLNVFVFYIFIFRVV
jgi:hypothetical protein